ncbi:hypothetical protein [Hydrogenophaga sp. 5NK40-0174]|uniref:hypothetical protein n=1 Tax=Hydrogenophaga sp. 5NK40-0174 TaxID=3127649 RepID=UPI003109B462
MLTSRETHTRWAAWLVAGAMAMSVAACGGSDDDPIDADTSEDLVAKYVGSWLSECIKDGSASAEMRADFKKADAQTLKGDVVIYGFVGTSCSGPIVATRRVLTNLEMSHVGTSTVDGKEADRFRGKSDEDEGKLVMRVEGNTLYLGDVSDSTDDAGYPRHFYDETLQRIE